MALTQVRAKLGEEWVVLAYNETTGRYEGVITAPGTSVHQPGGYYPIEVEAQNDSGDAAFASGETMASLRLTVRETAAPTLTLISPAPGYLQTGAPVFTFEAVDEEGGSGVDPESFDVAVGGGLRAPPPLGEKKRSGTTPAPYTVEPIPGGYRFTWSPPGGWGDGTHTVTAAVSDYDGNVSTVSGAYTVDTVPPGLLLRQPYMRHVVDSEHVQVVLDAWDDGSGVASVRIGGILVGADPLGRPNPAEGNIERAAEGGGPYIADVPLNVGENRIQIAVADRAGNITAAELYMIRLVTDRNQADVDAIRALWDKPAAEWTDSDRNIWSAAAQRGGWTAETLNRVGVAVRFLAGELEKRGYLASVQPKTDWTKQDAPTIPQMATYLQDVETVRSAQGVYVQEIPGTLNRATLDGFNAVERALVETDEIFPHYFAWTAGEITCGGV